MGLCLSTSYCYRQTDIVDEIFKAPTPLPLKIRPMDCTNNCNRNNGNCHLPILVARSVPSTKLQGPVRPLLDISYDPRSELQKIGIKGPPNKSVFEIPGFSGPIPIRPMIVSHFTGRDSSRRHSTDSS